MPDKSKRQRGGVLRALSFSSQVGLTMTACVFIGVFAGQYLDKITGLPPLFLLTFSLLGMASALWSVYTMMKRK